MYWFNAAFPYKESITKLSCMHKHRHALVMTADFQAVADVGGLAVSLHHLFSLHPCETVFRESGCDCDRDILKITQTRGRQMDAGRHRVKRTLYICCKFTCGLLCCEASVPWNAVKYTVTDCCVNTGIQIPLD